ncbi:MAG: hypothetical protein JSW08_02010 [archaeon]|nr:MAG: hypothetical protein JSW08_02010 [archaeon]
MVQEERGRGGIRERLDGLENTLEQLGRLDKKERKKKLKILKKVSNQKLRKNYVIVFLLKTNLQIDAKLAQIEDGTIYLDKERTYHVATPDSIWRYKKYPAIILKEWDLKPLTPYELYEETVQSQSLSHPQKFLIDVMMRAQLKKKGMKINMLWIILGIVGVVVIMALIGK